jgi:hypothetical protein
MQKVCMKEITAAPLRKTAVIKTTHKGKTMKLTRALFLVLLLSGSVYAGNMQNGITDPPPDQQATQPTTTSATETPQTPTVTEIVLTVVSVLGLH